VKLHPGALPAGQLQSSQQCSSSAAKSWRETQLLTVLLQLACPLDQALPAAAVVAATAAVAQQQQQV
jgi:hypothetical protein